MTCAAIRVKIKSYMGTSGRDSPSAARALSALEVTDLTTVALGLPDTWVATLEPPYGQLAITPNVGRRIHLRCHVASGSRRVLYRDGRLG